MPDIPEAITDSSVDDGLDEQGLMHVHRHGLHWVMHPNSDDHLGPSGHEDLLVTLCGRMLPHGGTFVDVGAHVGLYSLRLANTTPNSRVIAVEANPLTYATLCQNIALNPELTQVEPNNVAAWHRSGEQIRLFDANGRASGGSTGAVEIGEALPVAFARTITLDDLLAGVDRVDLIKIDVEGAETNVLRGAAETLARCRPALFIEMHDVYLADGPANRKGVEVLLEAAGYVHGVDIEYGVGYHWFCTPAELTDEAVMEKDAELMNDSQAIAEANPIELMGES